MQKPYEKLIQKLKKAPLSFEEFATYVGDAQGLYADAREEFEYLKSSGLPLDEVEGMVYLETLNRPINEQLFCIVDIETNGSKPYKSQIIEIGAIKMQNGAVVDRFESFVYCEEVPEYITKITNINTLDLIDAPMMCDVLREFRLFLGDALFVAHNVGFDFGFISAMMEQCGLGVLQNRRLCTIDLARKTIEAERYGLAHLNEVLEINTDVSHRAFADALTAMRVLEESFKNLPEGINTTEELIDFSLLNKRKKKKRKEKEPTEEA